MKAKCGWAKKLRERLLPVLELLEHCIVQGDSAETAETIKHLNEARLIFSKVRVCIGCHGRYFHDSESPVQVCDECEATKADRRFPPFPPRFTLMTDSQDPPMAPDLEGHDSCGPSSLGRLLACPGSLRLSLNEPELKSKWAREGDRCHEAVAEALVSGTLPTGLSEEERERCERCLGFVREKIAGRKVLMRWVEHSVELLGGVTLINYGTADLIVLLKQELLVFDFKFGRKVHRHSLVLQLANYAAAAATSIFELVGGIKAVWKEKSKEPIHRAQIEGGMILECETAPEAINRSLPASAYAYFPLYDESYIWSALDIHAEVPVVVRKIKEVIAIAEQEDAPVNPGPWCDYCNHLPNCEAVRERCSLVKAHFQSALPATPEKILELYDAAALAKKQASAVTTRIREVLDEDPQAIPGLSYSEVNGARSVQNMLTLYERLMRQDSLTYEELQGCVTEKLSVTQAEGLYIEKNYKGRGDGLPTKEELKKKFKELAGDSIKQPRTKRLRRTSSE